MYIYKMYYICTLMVSEFEMANHSASTVVDMNLVGVTC